MRFSCLTFKFVFVVLETSMYFSGKGNDSFSRRVKLDSGFNVMTAYEASGHGPKIIYRFTDIQIRVLRLWKRPFWFSKKVNITLSLNWSMPYQGGCSQVLISSRVFDSSICDWKNKFSIFFGEHHLLRIESLWADFRCVHRLQLLRDCMHYVTLDWVLRSYRMILNQWAKWNNRFFKGMPKTSFIGRLPIGKLKLTFRKKW